jgi:hypothetical protein
LDSNYIKTKIKGIENNDSLVIEFTKKVQDTIIIYFEPGEKEINLGQNQFVKIISDYFELKLSADQPTIAVFNQIGNTRIFSGSVEIDSKNNGLLYKYNNLKSVVSFQK